MDQNPYRSPLDEQPRKTKKRSFTTATAVGALAIVVASAIGGCALGGSTGMIALAISPRETRPMCGNTILEPCMITGILLGSAGGTVLAVRRLRR